MLLHILICCNVQHLPLKCETADLQIYEYAYITLVLKAAISNPSVSG